MTVPPLPAWIFGPDGESMILEREEAIAYYLGAGWTFTRQSEPAKIEEAPKRRGRPKNG